MTDRKPKRPRDTNQLAKRIVDIATGEAEDDESVGDPAPVSEQRQAEGRRRGGKARAARLTQEQREEISRIAANARWKKDD